MTWPMGVPPPLADGPIEQDLGEIVAALAAIPRHRAAVIRAIAYSYRMSPEAVEARISTWGVDAPASIQ